jgi:hypothetical protein
MRRVIGRLLVAAAAALPLSVAVWVPSAQGSVGSGLGTAVMKCMHFKDAMILTPGLSHTPANQTVNTHGRVYGCNKAGGGGKFRATLAMTAATCANRRFDGEGHFDWANGQSSTASLSFLPAPVEPKKVEVLGTITAGMFDGLLLHSFVRTADIFKGTGAGCSPSNPLTRIDFTNSQSLQLFTPNVPTTTVPQGSSTSAPASTTPVTTATAVTQGSFPTTAAITHVTRASGGGGGTPGPPGPGGSLAFSGNSPGGALLGLESLLVGGAIWALGGRGRRSSPSSLRRRDRRRHGARPWLLVTLPGDG